MDFTRKGMFLIEAAIHLYLFKLGRWEMDYIASKIKN